MAFTDLRPVMRANLPEPPARACSRSARVRAASPALRAVGYDVLERDSDDVRAVALADLEEPAGLFAAAIAVVSLHHSTRSTIPAADSESWSSRAGRSSSTSSPSAR
jgi:hypothetical protein